MRALVTELKRQKHAVTARKQKPGRGTPAAAESKDPGRSTAEPESARQSDGEPKLPQSDAKPERPQSDAECKRPPSDGEFERQQSDAESKQKLEVKSEHPRQRGRHVPAAIRRAVFERDKGRCTYADGSGRRCAETHLLEVHHLKPFARGGEHTEQNLTLRCRAHNALAAEEDFGRELIELARSASEHEPWALPPGA
jgi:5-methylcytosine-specific restriction endonuclease McrA